MGSLLSTTVRVYQGEEGGEGFGGGDVFFDKLLTFIYRDPARAGTDVAIVGISHLTGPIDDASHNSYLESFQVGCVCFYFRQCLLEVEKCPSATGAGDVFRLRDPESGGLKDSECHTRHFIFGEFLRGDNTDARGIAIKKQGTEVGSCFYLEGLEVGGQKSHHDDDRIFAAKSHETVDPAHERSGAVVGGGSQDYGAVVSIELWGVGCCDVVPVGLKLEIKAHDREIMIVKAIGGG